MDDQTMHLVVFGAGVAALGGLAWWATRGTRPGQLAFAGIPAAGNVYNQGRLRRPTRWERRDAGRSGEPDLFDPEELMTGERPVTSRWRALPKEPKRGQLGCGCALAGVRRRRRRHRR